MGAGGWEVVLASLPYGLLCTTVLMGKHIDKIGYDEPLGIRTLPVLLGETCAHTVTLAMMVGFYLLIAVNVMLAAMPWPRCWSPGRCPGWRKCGPISCDGGPSSRHRRFRCGRCGMPRWPGCTCVRPVRCWLWAWRSVPGGAPGDFR
ncbi:1,4-dihydroxy-2-naphthoate prenyltransferase [Mycobacterium tuberculosis]|uniref:1,4-dihydroxy-2-naphthoate prenyltransferase n=1 Tax=Mycobacterium tuberculosis TaxID=1773 RepID=UPI00054CC034|nr:1,4-dihydroxy-2-naphthoate prenyltransferase [Mycobacterium tuberculosis]